MKAIRSTNYIFNSYINQTLRLSTQAQECTKPAKKEVKKRQIKISKDVEQYINSSNHLLKIKHDIPIRFLKKNRKAPDDLYLVDSHIAKDIAGAIKPHILKRNKTIIETNPGFGFVTKELLEAGLKWLQLYDSSVSFHDHIFNLDKQYPEKLKVYNRDFFSIWKLSYQDRHDNGDRVKKMLSNVKVKQWHEDPAMTIIGTTASTNFIRHLILSLIFQFGIMTYGRCELFLIVPPYLYLQLTANPEVGYLLYRASSVLFQIFCDHEILLKLPRKAFLPWDNMIETKNNSKLWKTYSVDSDCMYLTRIEFKRNMPVSMDKLQHLWYFVQHMMMSRSSKVIPTLEKWIPGCGVRLILANSSNLSRHPCVYPDLNIFTQSGQLNPEQFLNLFKRYKLDNEKSTTLYKRQFRPFVLNTDEFSSWPEYSESPFLASMETALLKMESMQSMQDMDEQHQETEEHVEGKDQKKLQYKNLA